MSLPMPSLKSIFQKTYQNQLNSCRRKSSSFVSNQRQVTVHRTTASGGAVDNNSNHSHEVNASELVDTLLFRTRALMDDRSHHVVAYSGGIDSSLVAALLQQVHIGGKESVQAVLGISPAVSQEQVSQARSVAKHLNINLVELNTEEGTDTTYIANEGKACLACKTHLYTSLEKVANFAKDGAAQLYNGTNADDMKDSTRVGLIAAQNFKVVSPLSQITKQQVRIAAKHLGLPNWNAAAAPCLRSRLALGVEATKQHLQMIEKAERKVRSMFELSEASNLRVRMLAGRRAMIELDSEHVDSAKTYLNELQPYFQSLGFDACAVRAFKSGSVSRKVKEKTNIFEEVESQMTATA